MWWEQVTNFPSLLLKYVAFIWGWASFLRMRVLGHSVHWGKSMKTCKWCLLLVFSFLQVSAIVCAAFPGALIVDFSEKKKKQKLGFAPQSYSQPASPAPDQHCWVNFNPSSLSPSLGLDYPHGIVTVLILKCFWPLGPGKKRREGKGRPTVYVLGRCSLRVQNIFFPFF